MAAPNRIREMRKKRGLTLERLAERVGTNNQQISRLETGQRRLTVEWLTRLATALDCLREDLLPEEETPAPDPRPLNRQLLRRMGVALASHLEKEGMALNHLRFLEVTVALCDAVQAKQARGQMPTGIPADLKPMIRLIVGGESASD